MADKPWKVWEREVARDHGGERTGPTGRDLPDVKGIPLIAPECKYMARLGYREADMKQARENAPDGLMPVLFLKEKRTGRRRVVLDYADWLTVWSLIQEGNSCLTSTSSSLE